MRVISGGAHTTTEFLSSALGWAIVSFCVARFSLVSLTSRNGIGMETVSSDSDKTAMTQHRHCNPPFMFITDTIHSPSQEVGWQQTVLIATIQTSTPGGTPFHREFSSPTAMARSPPFHCLFRVFFPFPPNRRSIVIAAPCAGTQNRDSTIDVCIRDP